MPARSPNTRKFCVSIPQNAAALAGAGEAAYRSGNYAAAQRYLRAAVNANPQDANSRQLLATTDLVLARQSLSQSYL